MCILYYNVPNRVEHFQQPHLIKRPLITTIYILELDNYAFLIVKHVNIEKQYEKIYSTSIFSPNFTSLKCCRKKRITQLMMGPFPSCPAPEHHHTSISGEKGVSAWGGVEIK